MILTSIRGEWREAAEGELQACLEEEIFLAVISSYNIHTALNLNGGIHSVFIVEINQML